MLGDNLPSMNPHLSLLQPYPFERLRALFSSVRPNPAYAPISLGIGEPRHAAPVLVQRAYSEAILTGSGLSVYPATVGEATLRQSIAGWLQRRYGVEVDPSSQILPVNGTREALFAAAQTIIDPSGHGPQALPPWVICPNPFYQIYEGAALLAGARPYFVASDPDRNFALDWESVSADIWRRTQLLYVCSPANPTGAVMPLSEWKTLFDLSDEHGFVIVSDECYSEIYFRDEAPIGSLEAARRLGRTDFRNLMALTSLSKRSNVPGLRSGFCAGDKKWIAAFLLYRTYHGSAMSPVVQAASIAAWNDEVHVSENRAQYRNKFAQVTPMLATVLDVALPDAGFYLWAKVSGSDVDFARDLYALYNVTVLPGSFLARGVEAGNPGAQRIRMALVAQAPECVEAAERIVQFVKSAVH
jgi:N-succinyldiaminopimelate aminotransferase